MQNFYYLPKYETFVQVDVSSMLFSLNFTVSSTQKVISLGDYMGKLKSGSGSLFKFKEDKRNKVCPGYFFFFFKSNVRIEG